MRPGVYRVVCGVWVCVWVCSHDLYTCEGRDLHSVLWLPLEPQLAKELAQAHADNVTLSRALQQRQARP